MNSAGEALSNIDVKEISKTVKKTVDDAANTINKFADDYIKNQGNPFDFSKRHAEGFQENVSKTYDDSEEPQAETTPRESNVSFDVDGNESSKEQNESIQETADSVKTVTSDESQPEKEVESTSETENVDETVKEEEKTSEEKVPEEKEPEEQNLRSGKQLNLVIDGICADVKIKKSTNGKLNINYENNGSEKQKQMYEFYSYKEGNTVYAGIRKVGKAVFFFNFVANSIIIYVELPDYMGNVSIKTASGDISINGVNADRIVAEAASGDVRINEVYTTDAKVKTSSGDVEVNDINSVQLFTSTVSGDITSNNLKAQNLTMKTVSGDISSTNFETNIMEMSSMSGDISMLHLKAGDCKIRTQSGDLSLNDCSINNADVTTISGELKSTGIIGDAIRVCSTSGDVNADVNVKRCHASSKSGDVDITCNGDLILESSSTSGDVNVHLRNYGNGYTIKSRTTSGGLYINYADQHFRNLKTGSYAYGKGSSELILSSVSGDIHLND